MAGIPLINLAQNIPNGNFETWTDNTSGMPKPQHWKTQNEPEIIFVEAIQGHSGNFAACLNIQWDEMLKKYCRAYLNSEFQLITKKQYRSLSGYVKGNIENIDSLFVEVYLYFDGKLIGSGSQKILDNTNIWEPFNIPIQYNSNEIPNKARINITVSPDIGSHFLTTYCIDDLLLAGYEVLLDKQFIMARRI